MTEATRLEERLKLLKQAIQDQNKGKNTNVEKFELLWDLPTLIEKTPKEVLSKLVADYLATLTEVIFQTVTPISKSLLRVVNGAMIALFDSDSALRGPLNMVRALHDKLVNTKNLHPINRNAIIGCLGTIFKKKGMLVASLLSETVSILVKQLKANEPVIRTTTVEALKDLIEGTGMSGSFTHNDIAKGIKNSFTDKAPEVKIAVTNCVAVLGTYFNTFSALETFLGLCLKNLEDPSLQVRTATAAAMGKLSASACYTVAAQVPGSAPQQKAKKPANVWNFDGMAVFLNGMFVKAGPKKELRAAVAQTYVTFLQELRTKDLESNMELLINNILSFLSFINPKTPIEEAQHSRICVNYILRYGLGESLGEMGQQTMAKMLTTALQKKVVTENEFMVIALCIELSNLFLVLGEGALPMRDALCNEVLPPLFGHVSVPVRLSAAICMRCLGNALPFQLAAMINDANNRVKSLTPTKVDKNSQVTLSNQQLLGLQGNSFALAALLAVVPSTQLGIPNTSTNIALQIATNLLSSEALNAQALVGVTEAGWTIIGALMKLGSAFVVPRLAELFNLWSTALNCDNLPKGLNEVATFAQLKTPPLSALVSFLRHCPELLNSKVIKRIAPILSGILNAVMNFSVKSNTINLFKLNLYRAFQALPVASLGATYVALLRQLAVEIIEGPVTSFKSYLNNEDAILGPWSEELALVEDSILSDLPPRVERDLTVVWAGAAEESLSPASHIPVAVVDACMRIFPALFHLQPAGNRQQLLEHFSACVKQAQPQRKFVVQTNVAILILHTLRELMNKKSNLGQMSSIALDLVKGYVGDPTAEYRRLAGEAIGMLARLEGDALTSELSKSLIGLLRKTKEPTTRAGCGFALGCILRYVGGMRTTSILPPIVTVLGELCKDTSSLVRVWALHSMSLSIEAAGPAFSSLVAPSLVLLESLMLNEDNLSVEEFRCLGRVVHDIVSALGPELKANSATMRKCSAVAMELRAHSHSLVALESINFNQGLILFAPQTINVSVMLPFLRAQFTSPYLMLRQASVICLRQLAQINAPEVSAAKIEDQLFVMLDSERDRKLRHEVELLITSLLDSLAPSNPSYWIALCRKVILASSQNPVTVAPPKKQTEDTEAADDDVGILKPSSQDVKEDTFIARWRTKIFSMECVRRIIASVSKIPVHLDLDLARKQQNTKGQQDYLVLNLNELIKMAFTAATSDIEAMRPVGVNVMKDIVQHFSGAADPDYPGHSLLEQYQAQIASTLRPAFSSEASPPVIAAACSIVVPYVTSNIIRDAKGINKLLKLLTDRVDTLRDIQFTSYSERATTMVQLAILSALAQLYVAGQAEGGENIASHIEPYLVHLKPLWISVLRDYSVLVTQNTATQKAYSATFFTFSTISSVLEYYQHAWAVVLLACAHLVNSPYWKNVQSQTSSTPLQHAYQAPRDPKDDYNLLFGLSMVSLAGTISTSNAILLLQAFQQLLSPSQIKEALSQEVCKELLDVLLLLMDTAEPEVQLEVVNLLRYLGNTLEPEYFSGSGESLLCGFIEAAASAIHHHIPFPIFPVEGSSNASMLKPTSLQIVETSLAALSVYGRHLTDALRLLYGPTLLFIVIRVIELLCTKPELANLSVAAISSFKTLSKISGEPAHRDKRISASIVSVLEAFRKSPPLTGSSGSTLMVSLFVLLEETLDYKPDEHQSLHAQSTQLLHTCLRSDFKMQYAVLQGLKALLQSCLAQTQRKVIAFKYFQALAGDLVLLLHTLGKASNLTPDQLSVATEIVKVLVLAHSISDPSQQGALLSILLPSLIGMLRPTNGQGPLHDLCLQVLLKLASSSPADFKSHVATLTDFEKQQLQTSIQLSMSSQTQTRVESVVKPAAPLKLDFSKYKQ